MHAHSLDRFTHEHVFLGARHERNERRVWLVVGLTFAMMGAETTGGTMFGSLALVADGWHMSTHAAALSISALAYLYARRHARDPRFAFGTGKLGDLAGFASAVVLAMIALLIGYESVTRLVHPVPIAYREAVAIAALVLRQPWFGGLSPQLCRKGEAAAGRSDGEAVPSDTHGGGAGGGRAEDGAR